MSRIEKLHRRSIAVSIALAGVLDATGCGGTEGTKATTPTANAASAVTSKPVAGAVWQDPTYARSPTTLVNLAILPIGQSGTAAERFDQGMERVFAVTEAMTLRTRPYDLRSAMNASHDLVQWVSRVQAATYSPQDLAAQPNLTHVLTPHEVDGLSRQLNSNLMIAPIAFEVKDTGKATTGRTTYHAYELPSGKLLRMNSFEVTVPEIGESGEKNATVELILKIQADFSKNLL